MPGLEKKVFGAADGPQMHTPVTPIIFSWFVSDSQKKCDRSTDGVGYLSKEPSVKFFSHTNLTR